MNGKQVKTLKKMKASDEEIKYWKTLSKEVKGKIRAIINKCKTSYPTFQQALRQI
ncbi:MAG: hypothetical protein KAS32_23810 [Candidatus Peribacteraceae bacterium]|nr:hypothetical protein [Candidatus Peribacteraceae bacterium]